MVTHIVAWNLKPDLPDADKEQAALRDVMLYTEFTNEAALQNYQVHPEHVSASSFVKTMTVDRMCLDFGRE